MSDEEMDSEPVDLQGNLTCPVCRDIFNEPMILPCTHSFCRQCLEAAWKVSKICPVCRYVCIKQQPIPNRDLSNACASFSEEKIWRMPKKPLGKDYCRLHRKEFQLYCVKDEVPVCVDCTTLHPAHELVPINKAANICKEDLGFKIRILEKKYIHFKTMKSQFSNTMEFIKEQAGQAEKRIGCEFERLQAILNAEKEERLKAVADEEKEKISAMEELMTQITQDMATLEDQIRSIKRDMGGEDLHLVKNYQDLKGKAQWNRNDPEYPAGTLLDMSKHVGSLSFNIWKSLQPHIKYNSVVLDPNTASPWLSLDSELISVKESEEKQLTPDNPERFDPCVFVLGAQGFASGKHRWDVHVGDSTRWVLGVCKESVIRKKRFTLSTARGVWAIGLSKGVYSAMTPVREPLNVAKCPETIRIKLNLDEGEVSFWDLGTETHLCTLKEQFKEKVYPIFGPGLQSISMALLPGKVTVHAH